MQKWAWLVVVLYAVIIFAASMAIAVVGVGIPPETAAIIASIWVLIMALCQAGLLVVPVRVQSRRPVTKRHLLWPILVAVFSCVAMATAMFLAVWETIVNLDAERSYRGETIFFAGLVIVAIWIAWSFIFGFYTGKREPTTFMRRTVQFLIVGSILELLVAVPTHVIARAKGYCCAGFGTAWGLGLGLSVMLFAFGPGVFTLFVRRWQSVQPPQPSSISEDKFPDNNSS